ncbi:hypothetical protein [Corynebacterium sp. ES2715-CONJ3]|uniref:hypothetical protein n=1 Tax=Corynebacterium sp. ES2715-CONJ3 TaxID=2974028 RepID=UPI002168A2F1|nr:hypothetical protein [Corynebacterium sp. ES2715-CONJ3]MCS4491045.1 hypothetical protein [Corynebacterium sp. ES2715-CONJ3]
MKKLKRNLATTIALSIALSTTVSPVTAAEPPAVPTTSAPMASPEETSVQIPVTTTPSASASETTSEVPLPEKTSTTKAPSPTTEPKPEKPSKEGSSFKNVLLALINAITGGNLSNLLGLGGDANKGGTNNEATEDKEPQTDLEKATAWIGIAATIFSALGALFGLVAKARELLKI